MALIQFLSVIPYPFFFSLWPMDSIPPKSLVTSLDPVIDKVAAGQKDLFPFSSITITGTLFGISFSLL